MSTVKFINEIICIYFAVRTFQRKVDKSNSIFQWSWNFWEMFSLISFFHFSILNRQNKCNQLLFHVLNCIQFCVRKLLLSLEVLNLMFNYKVFSTKLYAKAGFLLRKMLSTQYGPAGTQQIS